MIALACYGRFGQYSCCLLERSRGNKGLCRQRRFSNTQQQTFKISGWQASLLGLLIFFQQLVVLNLVTFDQIRRARIQNIYFTQHLTHNNLNVLIVDDYTLQTINLLNLRNNVFSQTTNATQAQNVVRIQRPISDHLALLNLLTLKHVQHTPFWNQRLVSITTISWRDNNTLLALGFFTKAEGTGNLCQNRRLFWFTRLKEVSNTRQTTRNIAGFRAFLRNTGNYVTNIYISTIFHAQQGICWQVVVCRNFGAR
ncbi:hypothetical protein imdm_1837 [gamma proteobacterium IMCC2047]|nr:hypothetical protein imdm_1837 [gamma proteobacterium IMCC2047]